MKRASIALVFCLALLVAGTASAADIATYQKELKTLYSGLITMKQTPEFAAYGFGPGNKTGNGWMKSAIALRDRMENEKGLPYHFQNAAGDLINLGQTYLDMRKKGASTVQQLHTYEELTYTLRDNVYGAMILKP